ncbi:putative lipid II flippase FtsW [Rhodoblastus acidophilus]|uniref:Probable peptidoglycan glycosyltransferase FtsW n=1 Tax=Candidatus Rhodoblastus alkanivorans TaxID=2954117 RepID=A0ABS9Z8G2_9HYPH|nr:putative peptidoglycan glycosyltransferase FtsW [Candidatus Rhodoblastus alkanivorans]MCI4679519.1 putative lipid II flippase FtsW [Candidatus Rhodoblastus alkanivorans]MCI4683964.1 putative lipid II flippase FtsW [Candidatus Rhodoblastus alkanivorans]MDI4641283.1 putative lipid II flippase FtsW [Rhodoblastus acidophilus]
MLSRAERSAIADWWWTVDRWLLAGVGVVIVLGLVLIMAGSPPVADRLHLPSFHFVNRQVEFLIPTIVVMLSLSFLSPRHVRRAALVLYIGSMVLVVATLLFGHEVKGARRWIFGVEPSEFLKPAFVVLAAWAISEGAKRRDLPGNWLAILLFPATVVPLILQPDFGQTMLLSLVWGVMFFMAGLHWFWLGGLGASAAASVTLAYKFSPHVRSRIMHFLDPGQMGGIADTFQVDTALDSFISGGWFGKGPGEGVLKQILPDAHTDFIFAVTGEEFGLLFCMFIVGVYAFIVLRALFKAANNDDPFCRFATAGLALLFGIQASINIAVNLHLMPAKGMTLPFISYGGSSLMSLGITVGFLLAVTRKRPKSELIFDRAAAPAAPPMGVPAE